MKNLKQCLEKSLASSVLFLVALYQKTVSPDHGIFSNVSGNSRCRFYPSCSAYAIHAVRQYGLLRGSMASLWRILRCGPWSTGGYDPI